MDAKNEESKAVSGNNLAAEEAAVLRGKPANGADAESSLGGVLSAARERRGVSREQAASQTGIPKRYLQMMENNDYSLASDQLYVLPFMRRYATFLALDPEETAMRFVREVQHAENNPGSGSRIDQPLDLDKSRKKSGGWIGIVAVVVGIAIAGLLYITLSGRHSSDNTAPAAAVTSIPAAPAAASTTVSPAAPPLAAMNAGGIAPGGASTTMRSGTQAPAANQHP
jgi:cytoskeletal protein RodZ